MSMTLPRWFGRKTKKKTERKNEAQEENAKFHKSNGIAHESAESPVLYFRNEDNQNEDGSATDATIPLKQEKSQYVQEQETRSTQVTVRSLAGQTLNREIGSMAINYENSENILSTYPFVEDNHEKINVIMSPTIYGGR